MEQWGKTQLVPLHFYCFAPGELASAQRRGGHFRKRAGANTAVARDNVSLSGDASIQFQGVLTRSFQRKKPPLGSRLNWSEPFSSALSRAHSLG